MVSRRNVLSVSVSVVCALLLLSACSSGGGGDDSGGPLPATILINKVPDQTVYGLGEPVEVTTLVQDASGSAIANPSVELTSNPPADQQVGANRFVYLSDGTYTITAKVLGNTQGGAAVTASVTIVVDGHGPTIACADPIDGAILDQAPGPVTVTGSVDDLNGVSALSVNGAAVQVDASGSFSTPVDAGWGINFVNLAATDGAGREARRTCAFLLSKAWAPDTEFLSSTISLRARQAAFDDASRTGTINSVADILEAVLNGAKIQTDLDANLLSQNPVAPYQCFLTVITCLTSNTTEYKGHELSTNNDVVLQLVNGGLSVGATVPGFSALVRAHGQLLGIAYDETGWIHLNNISVTMIVDAALVQGRPSMSIRPGTLNVTIGSVSTDFSGAAGNIIDFLSNTVGLIGYVRPPAQTAIRDAVAQSLPPVLDGIVAGLDVHNLATAFDVPRLDGAGPVTVDFATDFSTLNLNQTRMLATMGTQFQSTPAHARPTLGAPIPSGDRLLDVNTSGTIAVALHAGLLDQALHALWRGGYFDAALSGGALNGLVPAGVTLELASALPPAVSLRDDGRIEIALGAVNVHLDDPALLPDPVDGSLGGRLSCSVRLDGESLVMEDCTVDEVHVSTGNTVLDAQIVTTVEQMLSDVLNDVLSTVINDALPAVPLPGFPLSASLAAYGIPTGELGLLNPVLTIQDQHGVLEGDFGIR